MTTALDIIEGSARLLGILRKGETLDADEAADGLTALNALLGSWSNDTMLVYVRVRENFTLTPGTSSYSIGTGQTFNTTKPNVLLSAFIRENNLDYPLEIINDQTYDAIGDKSTQTNLPKVINFSNGHPYGTIRLYETPSVANALHILSEKQLSSFSTTSDSFDLPAGWERALKFNLAVDIAAEYQIEPSSLVVAGAEESKGLIRQQINRNRPMSYMPPANRQTYNFDGDV